MTLQRSTKTNPCPVCNSGTKGCSYDTVTELAFCRGDSVSSEFTFVKQDNNNLFGIFKRSIQHSPGSPEYIQAKKQQQAKVDAYKKAKKEKFNSLLSIKDRASKYANLERELGLFPRHKEELINRGFKNPFALGFRSIKKYQKVSCDVSGIAGFNRNRKYVSDAGILCPIKDVAGNTLGYQVKCDDTSKGKYLWLGSSYTTPSHLQSGELPINVAKQGNTIVFCEGILKSSLASTLHGITVIGSSTVGSTPVQIKSIVEYFNLNSIVLYPDAGSCSNTSVVGTYRNLYNVSKDLGVGFKLADYGQWFDKEVGDIDEIDSLDSVELKDWQFFEACHCNPDQYTNEEDVEALLTKEIQYMSEHVKVQRRSIELAATSNNQWVEYIEGTLEVSDEYNHRVVFDGSAQSLYAEANHKRIKYILDTSQTGSGKSYSASNLTIENAFGDDTKSAKIINCSQSPRRPSTSTLETNYTLLPSRHKGLDKHEHLATPNGEPVLMRSKSSKPDIAGNCHMSDLFNVSYHKGLDLDICGKCRFRGICSSKIGNGFGFKSEIRQASKNNLIRANIQGLTNKMVGSNSLVIVDEYSRSVPWIQETLVKDSSISRLVAEYVGRFMRFSGEWTGSDVAKDVYVIARTLNDLLNEVKKSKKYPYGVGLKDLKEKFSTIVSKDAWKSIVRDFEVTIGQDNDTYFDSISAKELRSASVLDELVEPLWLRDFADAMVGKNVSLVLTTKGLVVKKANERAREILNQARTVIFQDATGSREDLALKLGVDSSEILEVRQREDVIDNVRFIQILGCGLAGSRRRENLQQRIDLIREAIPTIYGDNGGFIDYKKYSKPGDLNHFVGGRGSNTFQDKDWVCSIGTPTANLRSSISDLEALTGETVSSIRDPKFEAYVSNLVACEMIQEVGRLRANRRKGTPLNFFWISDGDTTFAEQIGLPVTVSYSIDYDLEAGDKEDRKRYIILETSKLLFESGMDLEDLTQKTLATKANISVSTLARLAKQFGGWDNFKLIIHSMVCGENIETPITDETMLKAQAYLPTFLLDPSEDNTSVLLDLLPKFASAARQLFSQAPVHMVPGFLKDLIGTMRPKHRLLICKRLSKFRQ